MLRQALRNLPRLRAEGGGKRRLRGAVRRERDDWIGEISERVGQGDCSSLSASPPEGYVNIGCITELMDV